MPKCFIFGKSAKRFGYVVSLTSTDGRCIQLKNIPPQSGRGIQFQMSFRRGCQCASIFGASAKGLGYVVSFTSTNGRDSHVRLSTSIWSWVSSSVDEFQLLFLATSKKRGLSTSFHLHIDLWLFYHDTQCRIFNTHVFFLPLPVVAKKWWQLWRCCPNFDSLGFYLSLRICLRPFCEPKRPMWPWSCLQYRALSCDQLVHGISYCLETRILKYVVVAQILSIIEVRLSKTWSELQTLWVRSTSCSCQNLRFVKHRRITTRSLVSLHK